MDLWTFGRYRQPHLCVDAVEVDDLGPALVLRQGAQTYRLVVDDKEAARQIAGELTALRDSRAPQWDAARACPSGEGWNALCDFLDKHSLIREADDRAAEQLAACAQQVEACIEGTAAAILRDIEPGNLPAAEANARFLLGRLHEDDAEDSYDPAVQPNFFLALATLEFEYFRRFSPLTLAAAMALLERLAGGRAMPLAPDFAEASALYDLHDLEAHLWLVARCVQWSASRNAGRLSTAPTPPFTLCSGLEFMRRVEIVTRETLGRWGTNPYVAALDRLQGGGSAPLVAGPFIEQYHVTRRFVEIIAPLLSRRLIAPLRNMMFRYYSEEFGHEALEGTTCHALGVSQEGLDRAVPLPLHFAFVDVLTLVANSDPLSSFASIMVIEGVYGEPPRMSLRLAAVARENPRFREVSGEHDDLNDDLNHNSISRDAFEHVVAVPPAAQARLMHRILFLLELNHRAWDGIAAFYGAQDALRLHGSYGQPLSCEGELQVSAVPAAAG